MLKSRVLVVCRSGHPATHGYCPIQENKYYYELMVLPSQVNYGWIGWVGVGIKCSKPLSAYASTQPHAYGGAAQLEVGSLPVSVSWSSALHCYLRCVFPLQSRQRPQPNPRTLMSTPRTPHQYWSANFIQIEELN